MSTRGFSLSVLSILTLAACEQEAVAPSSAPEPSAANIEAPDDIGNPFFSFLPPLAVAPALSGALDRSLLPRLRVEVCAVEEESCGEVVASFTSEAGGPERLRIFGGGPSGEHAHFGVNWDTRASALVDGLKYRVRVLVPDLILLGFRDIVPGKGAAHAGDQEAFPFNSGRTLPIRFGVEEGALPVTLTKVDGDNQLGPESGPLQDPLLVSARNEFGDGLPGVFLSSAVTSGSGDISPARTTTRQSGTAEFVWRLGNSAFNAAVISATDDLSVEFRAIALASRLSDTEPTIHMDGSPALVDFPQDDGEFIQVLGERLPSGEAAAITAAVKYDPGDPGTFDAVLLDESGRPELAVSRDGLSVLLEYPDPSTVVLRFSLPDGSWETEKLSLFPEAEVTAAPSAAGLMSAATAAESPFAIETNVALGSGEPVTSAQLLSAIFNEDPSKRRAKFSVASHQQNGRYLAPVDLRPLDVQRFCGTFDDLTGPNCAFIGTLSAAILHCPASLKVHCALLSGLLTIAQVYCWSTLCEDPVVVIGPVEPSGWTKAMTRVVTSGAEDIDCPRDARDGPAAFPGPVLASFSVICRSGSVSRVEMLPASLRLKPGKSASLTARAFDGSGGEAPDAEFAWSVSPGGVVELEESGSGDATVKGLNLGSTTVTATIEGLAAHSTVEVVSDFRSTRWRGDCSCAHECLAGISFDGGTMGFAQLFFDSTGELAIILNSFTSSLRIDSQGRMEFIMTNDGFTASAPGTASFSDGFLSGEWGGSLGSCTFALGADEG